MSSRGVFLLSDILDQQLEGTGVSQSEVFIQVASFTSPNTGYFSGGQPNPAKTDTEKTNFSTDTTSVTPSTNLSIGRIIFSAVGSQTIGYFGGGMSPTSTLHSQVDKLTYADETMYLSPGAQFNDARSGFGAVGNIYNAYFGGGRDTSTPSVGSSRTDKTTYSNDTNTLVPGAELSAARNYIGSGTGNASNGYIGGGYPSPYSTMDRIAYSTETTSQIPGASLSEARFSLAATGNVDAGYFGGGWPLPGPKVSIMDKLTYSSDTTAAMPGAALKQPGRWKTQASGNSTDGYFAGGGTDAASDVSLIDKLEYSTDTTSALPSADLTSARAYHAATGPRENVFSSTVTFPLTQFKTGVVSGPNFGYSVAGIEQPDSNPGNTRSSTDKLDLSTDTNSSGSNLATGTRNYTTGVSNTSDGYVCMGRSDFSSTNITSVDKITFSSSTPARIPSADSTFASMGGAGYGNLDAGYLSGGRLPGETSSTDKLTYSDETSARIPGANLIDSKQLTSGFGNPSAGYMFGGYSPGASSLIEKLSYSTETYSNLTGTTISAAKYGCGCFSNDEAGYGSGGAPFASNFTSTDKCVFSTETISRVPSADITGSRTYIGAYSNRSFGFVSGGFGPAGSPSAHSNVQKMTIATETYSSPPSANMSITRYSNGGIGGRSLGLLQPPLPTPTPQTTLAGSLLHNYGFLLGGVPFVSTAEKVNFATDAVSVTSTAALSVARRFTGGTGNITTGYIGGGYDDAPTSASVSTVDKLTYSNDTTARQPTADLSLARQLLAAVGNSDAGYFAGGLPNNVSTVDKLTYSNDTSAATPSAFLSIQRRSLWGTGNITDGYFGGGGNPGLSPANMSTVDKVTYSNDTTSAVPGAALSSERDLLVAVGNKDQGYFCGGDPGGFKVSTTDKLTYSTQTTAYTPSANLPTVTSQAGAVSGGSNGYIAGGYTPFDESSTTKLTYSTDTTSALPSSADLSSTRIAMGGVSSQQNAVNFVPSPVNC